jgi:hypothetical protein
VALAEALAQPDSLLVPVEEGEAATEKVMEAEVQPDTRPELLREPEPDRVPLWDTERLSTAVGDRLEL